MVGRGSGSDAQRWVENDFGAVWAVGVPSAVGLSLDAEAVVDLGVVPFAQQRGVFQAGLAGVDPLEHMVDVAPVGRGVAAGETRSAGRAAPRPGAAGGRPVAWSARDP